MPELPVKRIGDGKYETAPIIGERVLTEKDQGKPICGYGATTGVLPGTITQFNTQIINQQGTIVKGLIKVRLENINNKSVKGFQEGDIGGPVYVILTESSSSGSATSVKVGVVGHIVHIDNSDPNHKFFYYEPLNGRYNLITGSEVSSSMPNEVNAVNVHQSKTGLGASSSTAASTQGWSGTQAWLDSNYPLNGKCQRKEDRENDGKKRSEITKLDISEQNLIGELNLTGFVNLTELYCFNNNLTNLDLSNCLKLTILECSNNNLTKLDISNLSNLTKLYCFSNQLNKLDISNLSNLTILECFGNQLTNLNLNKLSNLTILDFSNNQLTNLDLSNCVSLVGIDCSNNKLTSPIFLAQLKPDKLKSLSIGVNNFKSDLTIFSKFTNLEQLSINMDSNLSTNTNSQWTGSLKPLKSLTKLKSLNIRNTDINDGLEHLPVSLTEFLCETKIKLQALSQSLIKELEAHGKPNEYGNYTEHLKKWQQVNRQVAKIQQK